MKVAIYARVSTEDQNVIQQVNYLKDWAQKQGHIIDKIVMDTESGTIPLTDRKKFRKLLDTCVSEAILIFNLDRLTRNWDDVTLIERHFREKWENTKLISTNESIDLSNASGRLMFRMKMVFTCYMPEDMKEKQKIGIERAKKQGKYKGRKKGAKNKVKKRKREKKKKEKTIWR